MLRIEPVPKLLGAVVVLILVAIVVGFAAASDRPHWQPQSITRITGSRALSNLTVTVQHKPCNSGGPHVRVSADAANRIVLRAEQDQSGDCEDVAVRSDVGVELSRPLGDRRIEIEPRSRPRDAILVCSIDESPHDRCG